jgi:hypothetical protein
MTIHLIDTPGFDDTNRKDADVLKDIAGWLGTACREKILLSGILYLHRIIDPRMQGTAKRNLMMFQQLCGSDCFPHICLVTTMWDCVDHTIGKAREDELVNTEEFWGYMTSHGSLVLRHSGYKESAIRILETVLKRRKKVKLKIQREMVDNNVALDDTKAGQQLSEDIILMRKKHMRELKELKDDMNAAREHDNLEAATHISELRNELKRKITAGDEAQDALRTDLLKLQKEREEEYQQLASMLASQAQEFQKKQQEVNWLVAQNDRASAEEVMRRDRELEELREQIRTTKETAERKHGTYGNPRIDTTRLILRTGAMAKIGKWSDRNVHAGKQVSELKPISWVYRFYYPKYLS